MNTIEFQIAAITYFIIENIRPNEKQPTMLNKERVKAIFLVRFVFSPRFFFFMEVSFVRSPASLSACFLCVCVVSLLFAWFFIQNDFSSNGDRSRIRSERQEGLYMSKWIQ